MGKRFSVVEIETASVCNLRCEYCPNAISERGLAKNGRQMPEALYFRIIDELVAIGFAGEIHPHLYNEPLLDPRIGRFIRYAREQLPGVKVVVFTNGIHLTLDKYRELVSSGVGQINITRHTPTEPPSVSPVLAHRSRVGDQGVEVVYNRIGISRGQIIFNRGGLIPIRKVVDPMLHCDWPSNVLTVNHGGDVLSDPVPGWQGAPKRAMAGILGGAFRTVPVSLRRLCAIPFVVQSIRGVLVFSEQFHRCTRGSAAALSLSGRGLHPSGRGDTTLGASDELLLEGQDALRGATAPGITAKGGRPMTRCGGRVRIRFSDKGPIGHRRPNPGMAVLDVGCGTGGLGRGLRRAGCRPVVGVEVDPEAARHYDRVYTADADDFDPPFADRSFDCIACADVLEHLRDPWALLSRLHRCLRPDGVLVASIPMGGEPFTPGDEDLRRMLAIQYLVVASRGEANP